MTRLQWWRAHPHPFESRPNGSAFCEPCNTTHQIGWSKWCTTCRTHHQVSETTLETEPCTTPEAGVLP